MQSAEQGIKDKPNQDFPHTSTDLDVGNGVTNRHLSDSSEQQARFNELSRKLEDTLEDASAWLELTDHPEAQRIVGYLNDAYDLLGESIEDSSEEELDPDTVPSPVRGTDFNTQNLDNRNEKVGTEAELEQELRETFPASDAPANY